MKDIFTVMSFTIKDMVKRKSFIISTLIILALIVIGFNIPNIVKSLNEEDIEEKLLIVDSKNVFEGNLEVLKDNELEDEIEIANDTYDQIKQKIEDEEIDSAIIIESENNEIKIRYIVQSMGMMNEIPEDIVNSISTLYSNIQISKLGLTQEQLSAISPDFQFSIEQTDEEEASGNILVMMLMSIVLFYAIYFCAYQVSSSITTEKTSKIIETLATSTSPKTIVLRKNNWNRNSRIGPNDSYCNNSFIKCKSIFR